MPKVSWLWFFIGVVFAMFGLPLIMGLLGRGARNKAA
jgi:hypothetical protein